MALVYIVEERDKFVKPIINKWMSGSQYFVYIKKDIKLSKI